MKMKAKLKIDKEKESVSASLSLKEQDEVSDKQQLEYLIEFVEEFKNYMDFKHITDLLKFVLLPLLQDEEKRKRFIETLEAAREKEETEIAQRLEQDPEALLDSIPHSGLALIKNTLQDFQEMTDEEREELVKQLYRTPEVFNMMNTKVTNVLFDPQKMEGRINEELEIVASKQGKKEIVIPTKVFISLFDDEGEHLPQSLTAYDRMVFDGYLTVIMNNPQKVATAQQIFKAFAGKETKSPQALGHITRSMKKMRNTWITLDITEHAQARGANLDKLKFSGGLIDFKMCEIESGGSKTWGFVALDTPFLAQYAAAVGQIITIDRALLEVSSISNTDNANLIKTYLLRRIEGMRAKRNSINSNRIKYDTMTDACGIQAQSKTEKARIRTTVKAILEYWKKQNYIKAYSEYKEGRSIEGVEVVY